MEMEGKDCQQLDNEEEEASCISSVTHFLPVPSGTSYDNQCHVGEASSQYRYNSTQPEMLS